MTSSTGITLENEVSSTALQGAYVTPAAKPSAVVARKVLDGLRCPSLVPFVLCACKGKEDDAVTQSGKTTKVGEEDVATLLTLVFTIIATILPLLL